MSAQNNNLCSSNTADVIIVGGGVIGLSIARALALRGVNDVLLIERAGVGSEASSAAAGMLAPQAEADSADDFFRLACSSRDLYPEFSRALREETGIDIELDQTGTIYVALTEEDENEIERRYEWQSNAGLNVEKMSGDEARLFEPCISEVVRGGLRFPFDTQVENRRLVSALAESVNNLGMRLLTSTTVESIDIEGEQIKGVQTSAGFFATRTLVLAAGAWTSQLSCTTKRLPEMRVEPVRGQMICFATNPRFARHVIYSPRGYIVPRMDGRLLAGSTTEAVGFDKQVTSAGLHTIISHALEISGSIATLPFLDSWAGLRPRVADGLPVLGPYAEIEGLFYATGHYRNGILLAPITGELIVDSIVNNRPSPIMEPFSPNRFGLIEVK